MKRNMLRTLLDVGLGEEGSDDDHLEEIIKSGTIFIDECNRRIDWTPGDCRVLSDRDGIRLYIPEQWSGADEEWDAIVKGLLNTAMRTEILEGAERNTKNATSSAASRTYTRGIIHKPPAHHIAAFADFFFSKKANDEIFFGIIADMRGEIFEAVDQGRTKKARWIWMRGHLSFVQAVVCYLSGKVSKQLVQAFKIS